MVLSGTLLMRPDLLFGMPVGGRGRPLLILADPTAVRKNAL